MTPTPPRHTASARPPKFVWPVYFLSQLFFCALLAWHLLAQFDFGYSWGYQLLKLDQHIAEYAPLNRIKQGFAETSPQEHWRLFGEISQSIQHHGEGLEQIQYSLKNGSQVPLLHQAEITHLQDVSHLIDQFYFVGILSGLIYIGLSIFFKRQHIMLPSARQIALGFGLGSALVATIIFALGPTTIFYWFHTKIFPDGHQWFFYYEDSLMTTLMKAPDIFAFIALELVALWALFLCLSQALFLYWPKKVDANKKPTKSTHR